MLLGIVALLISRVAMARPDDQGLRHARLGAFCLWIGFFGLWFYGLVRDHGEAVLHVAIVCVGVVAVLLAYRWGLRRIRNEIDRRDETHVSTHDEQAP